LELRAPFRRLTARWAIGIDITVLVLLFVFVEVVAGAFPGTPINDDWAYARILEEFVHTGRFIPLNWIGMNLFTQTVMAYPFVKFFGVGWSTLHLFALAMGATALALTLVWLRQLGTSRGTAFTLLWLGLRTPSSLA